MRVQMTYGGYQHLTAKLPIATTSSLYDAAGGLLGSVKYNNLKVNTGLKARCFR